MEVLSLRLEKCANPYVKPSVVRSEEGFFIAELVQRNLKECVNDPSLKWAESGKAEKALIIWPFQQFIYHEIIKELTCFPCRWVPSQLEGM